MRREIFPLSFLPDIGNTHNISSVEHMSVMYSNSEYSSKRAEKFLQDGNNAVKCH